MAHVIDKATHYINLSLGLSEVYRETSDSVRRIRFSVRAAGTDADCSLSSEDKGVIRIATNSLKARVNAVIREVPYEIRHGDNKLSYLLKKAITLVELEDFEC